MSKKKKKKKKKKSEADVQAPTPELADKTRFDSRQIIYYVIPAIIVLIYRFSMPYNICDDAYITMSISKNLGSGLGAVFNLGQPIYVSTTPLWMFLIALLKFIGFDTVVSVIILGTIFEVLLMMSMVYLGKLVFNSHVAGMLCAVFLGTNPVFAQTSHSGMEVPLYIFIIVTSVVLFLRGNYTACMIMASAAVWARFDGMALAAVMGVSILIVNWKKNSIPGILKKFAPGAVVFLAYFAFGYLYYNDFIPASVQRKAQIGVGGIFHDEWIRGVGVTSREFFNAFFGISNYWYVTNSILIILPVPLVFGCVKLIKDRNERILPIVGFAVLYAASFIGKAWIPAANYPWYFTPHLAALYLVVAGGTVWIIVLVMGKLFHTHNMQTVSAVAVIIGILWAVLLFSTCKTGAERIRDGFFGKEREYAYAVASVWTSSRLKKGATTAVMEVGAIRFYTRPDINILDLEKLASLKNERHMSYDELMEKHDPEVYIIRKSFAEFVKKLFEPPFRDKYDVLVYRTLLIGIKKGIAPDRRRSIRELQELFDSGRIRTDREYVYPSF